VGVSQAPGKTIWAPAAGQAAEDPEAGSPGVFAATAEQSSSMSEHQHSRESKHSKDTDIHDAILAADDTGMVRNEADIVSADISADIQEATEIPQGRQGA
jgi:hypothetical protein